MSANESTSDRAIRILFGAALVSLVFFGPQSAWGWLGLIPIVTGARRVLPAVSAVRHRCLPGQAQPASLRDVSQRF